MDCTVWILYTNKHVIQKIKEEMHTLADLWFGLNQELFKILEAK